MKQRITAVSMQVLVGLTKNLNKQILFPQTRNLFKFSPANLPFYTKNTSLQRANSKLILQIIRSLDRVDANTFHFVIPIEVASLFLQIVINPSARW